MKLRYLSLLLLLFLLVLPRIFASEVHASSSVKRGFYPIADAYVSSKEPSSRHGEDEKEYLESEFWEYEYTDDVRENSYLMFDLSMFSPGTDVSSVVLRLYAWSAWAPTANVAVHYCSDNSWNESKITWSNAPSFSPSVADTVAVPAEHEWYVWNVTSLARNALGGKLTLVLTVQNTGDSFTTSFYSKECYSPQYSPQMIIEYSAEGVDPIVVDGDPTDWLTLGLAPAGTDPPYNIKTYQQNTCADLLEAWVHNDSAYLYLMIRVRGGYPDKWQTTMYAIMMDTDQNASTGSPEGYDYMISAKNSEAWLSIWNETTLDFEPEKRVFVSPSDLGYVEWCVLLNDIKHQEKITFTFNTIQQGTSYDGIVNSIVLQGKITPKTSSFLIPTHYVLIATLAAMIILLVTIALKRMKVKSVENPSPITPAFSFWSRRVD